VGSSAAPRQITNVAPGTAPTDAVNRAQLDSAGAQLAARLTRQFGSDLQGVRDFAARGVAQAMAMPTAPGLQPGRRWVGAAVANYAGQSALGLGFAYQLDTNWQLGGGLSVATGNGSQVGARLQAGYQW
jgi:autotransporter adhesin